MRRQAIPESQWQRGQMLRAIGCAIVAAPLAYLFVLSLIVILEALA